MEPRLIVAYALIAAIVLAGATFGFRLWYMAHDRTVARQRLRDRHRQIERRTTREAARQD